MSSMPKGPTGIPNAVITRSICATDAPSSSRRYASRRYCSSIRLATNPKQLPTTTPTLPRRLASFCDVAIVSGPVSRPRTISTSFMTFAGLKKWWPMTFGPRPLARASASMSSVEVFDASTQSGRVTRPRSANVDVFSAMSSKTASTTMSTASKPSYVVVGVMSPIARSSASAVILPFATDAS